ncbi:hypothetical protein HP550_17105 [Cellulomonas humilata]|uniref:Uncharacterized protein n=1 Tax=Cellulomonas humilata TaxID=144055 RepID=A0A7Y6A3D2_9CELL|nr:hypothetical protein [Cellulomonas humilata]NUU18972.1 hypothetical protein [Cellulomonas humilata]
MHPELAIAMYRHQEHQLEVRLEQRRSHLEKAGQGAPRRHRPFRHHLRARR